MSIHSHTRETKIENNMLISLERLEVSVLGAVIKSSLNGRGAYSVLSEVANLIYNVIMLMIV